MRILAHTLSAAGAFGIVANIKGWRGLVVLASVHAIIWSYTIMAELRR